MGKLGPLKAEVWDGLETGRLMVLAAIRALWTGASLETQPVSWKTALSTDGLAGYVVILLLVGVRHHGQGRMAW